MIEQTSRRDVVPDPRPAAARIERRAFLRRSARLALVAGAVAALGGCVIAPYPPRRAYVYAPRPCCWWR